MKWILMIILIASVAILGCSPSGKAEQTPEPNDAEDMGFDEAMGSDIDTSEWITNYEAALKTAKKTNRPVLVNFTGSDWCSWCIKLVKEVFSQDEFLDYAKENLVLLKLDFPKSLPQTAEEKAANAKLAQQYGIQGYPTILLISPEGKEIARTGYQPGGASAYVKHLQSLLAAEK
ncbi:MAG: thioredoxin family protein [Candidatus Cloacimonetes bacterium]|nr:thioredoxin family protein [Candidatus Cloacimonadota bacterium]